jgi:hypothetical protein
LKSRRSATDTSTRLLDLWQSREDFGKAIGCVTTTYTFDGTFFEEDCLGRFVGMETDASEDVRTYLIEREEKLNEVFAAVLVDRKNVARSRSLRWHQLPVAVPNGKLFHAKVSLLAWTNRIRVLIGSPNLTKMGYRNNYEHLATLDFGPDEGTPTSLLDDVVAFLKHIATFLPRSRSTEEGPVERLQDFLSSVGRTAKAWQSSTWRAGETRAVFLPVFPGRPSLFDQIRESVWQGTGASAARVTSPFFDPNDRARDVIEKLVSIMGINGEREITFHASGTELPDHSIDLGLPESFRKPWLSRVKHSFAWSKPYDAEGNNRPLHTKCLSLERDENRMFLIGSSNFTAAGTGTDPNCNVEANLAYVVPPAESKFWRLCEESVPPSEIIDMDRTEVRFLKPPEQTPESEMKPPLPTWFEQALFDPTPEGGRLSLSFSETSHTFSIKNEDGELILSSSSLTPTDGPITHSVEWKKTKPPSYLLVEWMAADDVSRESIWVVNVTDASKLPPPAELRDLSLEKLVEVLTSSRPLYEAVERALEHQARIEVRGQSIELDPHHRVDTSGYLLKRVQRVSRALEGLRERLERPVSTFDALRWRLRGPIGAMALARRLLEESDPAAVFLIAEIALTLDQVRWHEAERFLGKDRIREEVALVQRELQSHIEGITASRGVEGYARRTFLEIGI